MARISGINLQDSWKIDYALTKIKGIGWTLSNSILTDMKVGNEKKVSDLTKEEISKLASKISQYDTEGELNRQVRTNISRLRNIGSYRGIRHARGLPSRGQRTRSNARTKRGRRKTVGAFRKEALVKMQQPKT
ncbi:30S ribosomal protein S13 [bacterium]|nr:30S ribosomal protein S13 [bacterium]